MHVFRDVLGFFAKCAEVAVDLNAMPKVFGLPEEGAEADRHLWGDRALGVDDFVNQTLYANSDRKCLVGAGLLEISGGLSLV